MPRPLLPFLLLALLASGCAPHRAPPDLRDPGQAAAANAALLPTRLVIHPLTRFGADAAGKPALLLHLELRDRFDQNTRALGAARITISRGGADQELAWNIDLRDPDQNALLYDDLITRTYSLTLTGLPDGLTGAATVAAAFSFPDPSNPAGPARTLSDSVRLSR